MGEEEEEEGGGGRGGGGSEVGVVVLTGHGTSRKSIHTKAERNKNVLSYAQTWSRKEVSKEVSPAIPNSRGT